MMDKPNNTNDKVYFNLTYFALKLLGKSLYSNAWTAISELVANGIDANAKHVKLLIDMRNKKHATIEVYDDGDGMSYDDLVEKYVVVGKDKRLEEGLTKKRKEEMLGRKGIGKLAALYLSSNYYICTKKNTKDIKIWNFKYDASKESAHPMLTRYQEIKNEPYCYSELNNKNSGTIIYLTNVDLTNIGDRTIEGLKQRISDYYLYDSLECRIQVCILNNENDEIRFEDIKKHIAFKNIYALFDNTKYDIGNRISNNVYIKSAYEEIQKKKRKTIILDKYSNKCKGKKEFFKKSTGEKKELNYFLEGWIGIHSSIDSNIAQKNDAGFLKNKAYNPFKLRLYVRKKLAVDNFLTYLVSTQAFSNYIEGEISFDILDNNELDDIATSSREGFPKDDERIQLLIDIVDSIVKKLIKERIEIGNKVTQEEIELKEEEERKRKEEEEKKNEAIVKYENEKQEKIKAKQELSDEKSRNEVLRRQNVNLFNSINDDQSEFVAKTHLIKTNLLSIRNSFQSLVMKIDLKKYSETGTIALCIDKTMSLVEYGARANFNVESETIKEDLSVFIEQYCKQILKAQYDRVEVLVNNKTKQHTMKFNPQYVALIFDNLFSNSDKNKANKICIEIVFKNNKYYIKYSDDGNGINTKYFDHLFELGISYTHGTGIGMFNIKQAVNKLGGDIKVDTSTKKGATFDIIIGGK